MTNPLERQDMVTEPESISNIRDIVLNAERNIQKNVLALGVHWLQEFTDSPLSAVIGNVELTHENEEIPEEEYTRMKTQLDSLAQEVNALRGQYEVNKTVVPEEIQRDLLRKLNVLLD